MGYFIIISIQIIVITLTLVFPPTSEVARLKGGAVYAEYDNVSLAARLTLAIITYDESRKADIIILCIHRATFQARHLSVFTRRWEHQR